MKSVLLQRYEVRQEGLSTGRTTLGAATIHTVAVDLDRRFSLPLLRLREIETTIKARHGIFVPDPEDTDDRDWCLDYGRAVQCSVTPQNLHQWAWRWLPWAMPSELDRIIAQEGWRQKMIGADDVATMLCVTAAERQALDLRTIGACDIPKEMRAEAARITKRERDRKRQAEKRRAEGRVDRQTYLESSLSAQRPWDALGISRSTYERRRRRDASVSPVDINNTSRDRLASPAESSDGPARRVA